MEISDLQLHAAYAVAKRAFEGEISTTSGAQALHELHALNVSSAKDLINNFAYMMDGSVFHRTMSAAATEIYLSGIESDYGVDALARAISAYDQHIEYYESLGQGALNKMRSVVEKFRPHLDQPVNAERQEANFQRAVARAMGDSPEARAKRLATAPVIPKKMQASMSVFLRNQDVVAEVLLRANGVCEACGDPAPFARKSDGTPYLEVHHTVPLAKGGHDTVANAIAVCPNCHRKFHYGA